MTPFGAAQQQPGSTQGGAGERWELRQLTIVEGQEKQTNKGKVYWRVKDSENHWYSVWETSTKVALEAAAGSESSIACAVQIKPSNSGGSPFYTIAAAGPHASSVVEEGKVKAVQSQAPGGRGSEFGKRMHPDDALRVTNLATMERAIQMVAMTLADKPENTKYETYVKSKVVEYMNFLAGLINQPLTPTPGHEEGPPPLSDEDVPQQTDDGIPF